MPEARFLMEIPIPLWEIAEERILQGLRDAVKVTTAEIAADVRANIVAEDLIESGAMLASVEEVEVDEWTSQVEVGRGFADPYPLFQEFGTGEAGAASGVEVPPEYTYGASPGIPATPFVRPAVEHNVEEFVENAKQAFRG